METIKRDELKHKDNQVLMENHQLTKMFVNDFLSLNAHDVLNNYNRFTGAHPLPPQELIYLELDKRDISCFLSSDSDQKRKLSEQFDGVLLIRDTDAGQSGFRLIYLENGDYTKGRFFLDEKKTKRVFIGDCVLEALEWDFDSK